MTRNPLQALRPSFTTRRTLLAVFWSAVTFLATGGVVALAVADEPGTSVAAGPPPASIAIAAPRLGDVGNYTLTVVEGVGDAFRIVEPARPYLDFEWTIDRPMRDQTGRLVQGQALRHRFYEPGEKPDDAHIQLVYAGPNGASFAQVGAWGAAVGGVGTGPSVGEPTREDRTSQTFSLHFHDQSWPEYLPPCGLRFPAQGTSLDLGDDFAFEDGCFRYEAFSWFPCIWYHAVGTDRIGPWQTVVLETSPNNCPHSTPRQFIWLAAETPYPVRVMQDADRAGRFTVMDLVGFAQGKTPLVNAVPSAGALPPLAVAPRQPWGPDDSDLAHSFKLSQAFAVLRDHEDSPARSFFRSHPDAYVTTARYQESHDDGEIEVGWIVALQDGTAVDVFGVSKRSAAPIAPGLEDTRVPLGLARAEYSFSEGSCKCQLIEAWQLPKALPTVASLMERWRLYASPEFATMEPNAWTFAVSCTRAACDSSTVSAGVDLDEIQSGQPHPLVNQSASRVWTTALLEVRADGLAQSLREGRSTYERVPVSSPPPAANEGVATSALRIDPVPDWWRLPAAAVAGAGAFAVLIGVVYWLWPSIKSAGLASLFSRVERDSALDQATRSYLHHLVEQSPGIHFQELVRRTGKGRGTIDHHMRKLVHVGLVVEQAGTGYTCYFPKGVVDRRVMAAAPALKGEGARAILRAVITRNARSGLEIAAATGLNPGTVSYHVKRLAAAALVTVEQVGREVRVQATDLGRTSMGAAA